MRTTGAPCRLPQGVDPAPLVAAAVAFDERAWLVCPADGLGDAAVPLVAVGGTANFDHALAGHVRATPALAGSPALVDALAAVGVVVTRARLVRLRGAVAGALGGYHWFRRAAICVVIAGAVMITCGEASATLAPGEVWAFTGDRCSVQNLASGTCTYLVIETRDPALRTPGPLRLEPYTFEVLSDDEFDALTAEILADLDARAVPDEPRAAMGAAIAGLRRRWRAAFGRFGHDSRGELTYLGVLAEFRAQVLARLPPTSAGGQAAAVIDTMLTMSRPAPRKLQRPPAGPARAPAATTLEFDRPVFVVSAPRAGSTVLFDLLARLPGVWTIGEESHALLRGIAALHPEARGYRSDRLTAADASPEIAAALRGRFAARLIDRDGRAPPVGMRSLRLVEKTPANALRIPFLRAVFPGALFVHLHRDARENISSLVEGWRSRRFLAYRDMPGWPHGDWSFLLPPGWESLVDRSLVEIAAYQWRTTHAIIAEDLRGLPDDRVIDVGYDALIAAPGATLRAIAAKAGLAWDERAAQAVASALPLSRVTVSAPAEGKWRRHEDELAAVLSGFAG